MQDVEVKLPPGLAPSVSICMGGDSEIYARSSDILEIHTFGSGFFIIIIIYLPSFVQKGCVCG